MGATYTRMLRSGRSLWQSRPLRRLPQEPLVGPMQADVIILGAGISGAMVADQLSEAGLSVLLLDRRGALQGSTPASTALLQYEIDVPLCKLSETMGRLRAERIWRRSKLALDALRERTRVLDIQADLVSRDSLYLEGNVLDAVGLEEEVQARRQAGFEATFLDRTGVRKRFGIGGRAALLGYDNLTADPRRLAAGFLRAALARGARILAPVEALEVVPQAHGVKVETNQGLSLKARHLVFATGYELPKGVPRQGHTIISTWALATVPQPRRLWPERCLIWEASDPYLYLRTGPQGEIICGGEDEPFSDEARRDAQMNAKMAVLQRKLKALLPQVDPTPTHCWSGHFGASDTGTPSIGPVPGMAHCFAVLGYGGNGITFSMMAAQMLRAMLTAEGDEDADLFRFSRDR